MTDLIVDNEFKSLIPPLIDEEFKQLEENILHDGIREPLTVWNGILIDGHNRYEIAQTHGLEFTTVEMQFNSRDDVKIWIADNQFGRRDLTAYERSVLALKLKPLFAKKAKENQGERTDLLQNSAESSRPIDTRAGVSHDTIAKVEKIEAQATPEVKAALKAGEISINSD